eukprot:scaffold7810_cov42-Attheya_sp.AAC.1
MTATSRLQLSFRARKLKNASGMFSKSNPFCVVHVLGDFPSREENVVCLGRTETVNHCLDPSWTEMIMIEGYRFGKPFYFEVTIYDDPSPASTKGTRSNLSKSDSAMSYMEDSGIVSHPSRNNYNNEKHRSLSTNTLGQEKKLKCMGKVVFELGEVLGKKGNVLAQRLNHRGTIWAHVEKSQSNITDGSGVIHFQLRGLRLKNRQAEILNQRSRPFFELYRKEEHPSGAIWNNVYRSESIKSLNPFWDAGILDLERFSNGDMDRTIKVVVWGHQRKGRHKVLGEFITSVRRFVEAQAVRGNADMEKAFSLLDKKGNQVGSIVVVKAEIIYPENDNDHVNDNVKVSQSESNNDDHTKPDILWQPISSQNDDQDNIKPSVIVHPNKPELIDYLSGGCEISLALAIDFTTSNGTGTLIYYVDHFMLGAVSFVYTDHHRFFILIGNPSVPGTLHYMNPTSSSELNDYEKAIQAVGTILSKYDADQIFPIWGFGAKYENVTRHCFRCGSEAEVHGVKGMLDAYRDVFSRPLTMSQPAIFTEVIRHAASYATKKQASAQSEHKQAYTILLILTAGNVEGIQNTKAELVRASEAPLSVVIVGIGTHDFSSMQFLDEHDPENEGGRDITKFVEWNDFSSNDALTDEVLDEIPDQVVDYFYTRGILPLPPVHCDDEISESSLDTQQLLETDTED